MHLGTGMCGKCGNLLKDDLWKNAPSVDQDSPEEPVRATSAAPVANLLEVRPKPNPKEDYRDNPIPAASPYRPDPILLQEVEEYEP